MTSNSITNHNYDIDSEFLDYEHNLSNVVRNDDTEPIISSDRLTSVSSVIDVNGRPVTEVPRTQTSGFNDRTPLLRQIR